MCGLREMQKILVCVFVIFLGWSNAFAQCLDNDLVIAMTGDTIFHGSLYVQAFKNSERGEFQPMWSEVVKYLDGADLMYTNIEGPVAPGLYSNGKMDLSMAETYHPTNGMYSLGEAGKSYTFNFHPQSIRELVNSGFTLFSLANNHSLDRRKKGADLTLDFFNNLDVTVFGTKKEESPVRDYIKYVFQNSYKLSFISCTYGNNVNIKNDQVLLCYKKGEPNPLLLDLVQEAHQNSEAVIVTPHWGNEYSPSVSSHQKKLAKALVLNGAHAIVGHHPHVVQPIEFIESSLGYKVPVIYSLGNFVSNQAPSNWRDPQKNESRFKRRVGMSAFLGFDLNKGTLSVSQIKFLPTYMKIVHEGEKDVRKLLPAYSRLYGSDQILSSSLDKAKRHVHQFIDSDFILTDDQLARGVVCD